MLAAKQKVKLTATKASQQQHHNMVQTGCRQPSMSQHDCQDPPGIEAEYIRYDVELMICARSA